MRSFQVKLLPEIGAEFAQMSAVYRNEKHRSSYDVCRSLEFREREVGAGG
jgi:hypothetical protein